MNDVDIAKCHLAGKPVPSTRYTRFIERGNRTYPGRFSTASLAQKFVTAYEHGSDFRVKVQMRGYDKPVWGYVSVTTGWVPSFMLMKREGQVGSYMLLNDEDEILEARWIERRYRPSGRR